MNGMLSSIAERATRGELGQFATTGSVERRKRILAVVKGPQSMRVWLREEIFELAKKSKNRET